MIIFLRCCYTDSCGVRCDVVRHSALSLHYSHTKAEDLSSIFLQHDKKKQYILYGGRLAWWGSSWWLLVRIATSKQAIITESSEWEFVHSEKGTIELKLCSQRNHIWEKLWKKYNSRQKASITFLMCGWFLVIIKRQPPILLWARVA